jgi:hypothetical protein
VPEPVEQIAGPGQALWRIPEQCPQVQSLWYGGAAPVAAAGERPVEGDDQRLRAGPPRPLGPCQQGVAVRGPVHLEEQLRVDPCHVRRRLAGELAQPHRGPRVASARGDGDLAERVYRLRADRRGDHRQVDVDTEDRRAQVTGGGQVRQARRGELELAERRDVVRAGDARLGTRLQGEENGPGQPPAGAPARLGDRLEPVPRARHGDRADASGRSSARPAPGRPGPGRRRT